MSRLPIVNFKTMDALLLHLGFVRVRQARSHVFYRHPDGRTTTIPNLLAEDLARPLIAKYCGKSTYRPTNSWRS